MRQTVVNIASMFSYKYSDFNSIGVPCPISCDKGCMKVPRVCIGADTVDPITSIVRRVNFELEIIENRSLFTDKTEFLHRAVLVPNLKGTWWLELSIHCALSGSVIHKSISAVFG